MIEGRKILITGPAGQIAFPLAKALAERNEVWGIARFGDAEKRREVEAAGIKTLTLDLEKPDFSELPRDFTHLLHLAASFDPNDYSRAIRINAEGTGLLLSHCRNVLAALVMSTTAVYKPHDDPWHAFHEDDPLGDIMLPGMHTYSVAKISEEAVARFCAREFGIKMTIARMGASYGPRGGLPIFSLQALMANGVVKTRWDPCVYSPIHDADILAHVEPLLDAATTPATIVNWAGDERVALQEWVEYGAGLLGIEPKIEVVVTPGTSRGSAADHHRRLAITGPCHVPWRGGVRAALAELYPDRVKPA
jgi:nucleoside-diphosphate-sugar epimerase